MGNATKSRGARAAALALAVWFGGLSCVLGCAAETAEAAHAAVEHRSASCSDGCCPVGENPQAPRPNHPAREMDCCVALMTPTALTGKIPTLQDGPEAAAEVIAGSPGGAAAFTDERFVPDLPFLDRSGTYLRLRVLRI